MIFIDQNLLEVRDDVKSVYSHINFSLGHSQNVQHVKCNNNKNYFAEYNIGCDK